MRTFLLTVLLTASNAFGQLVSPEVQADGRITFRLRATNAVSVELRCEGVSATNLVKDDQNIWSQTVGPLEPDIYVYSFNVDGLHVIDPANPLLKYNLLATESEVHVPGPKSLAWEINDVPRGQLHRHFYASTVSDDERDFLVYTPPGYDPTARKRYPVLYLLHGFSDDATTWTSVGRANVILDNLIARGQARPMIVVMPLGYGTMDYVRAGWTGPRRAELRQRSFEKFRDGLFNEVIPRVEKAYRTASDRRNRAIAGLSMGGAESLFVGLNALDRFAWIGAFSSGGLSTNFPSQYPAVDAKTNDRLRLLWIGCGQQDNLITQQPQSDRLVEIARRSARLGRNPRPAQLSRVAPLSRGIRHAAVSTSTEIKPGTRSAADTDHADEFRNARELASSADRTLQSI